MVRKRRSTVGSAHGALLGGMWDPGTEGWEAAILVSS